MMAHRKQNTQITLSAIILHSLVVTAHNSPGQELYTAGYVPKKQQQQQTPCSSIYCAQLRHRRI